jgi:two-component system NtrC family sensor kinase
MGLSLRLRLTAVMFLVLAVLAAALTIETRISERTLRADLSERAAATAEYLDLHLGALWGHASLNIVRRQLLAIKTRMPAVFLFSTRVPVTISTEPGPTPPLTFEERTAALSDRALPPRMVESGVGRSWQVTAPLHTAAGVAGGIRVRVSLAPVDQLHRRMLWLDGITWSLAAILIAGIVALFFNRDINRPLRDLVGAMNQAKDGRFDVRVQARGAGELREVAAHFNRMLDEIARADAENRELLERLSHFNQVLEERVQQATEHLAERNRDLTRVNDELWRLQRALGRSERLAVLGQAVAAMAHELGTPLNSVLGYTQLLQRDVPPQAREKLAVIENEVRRMTNTIRTFLDQSRDTPVERRPTDLRTLVTETLDVLTPNLTGKAIRIHTALPVNLPVVPADPDGVQHILLNLLTNAVDAVEGHGEIEVGVRLDAARAERGVEITVTDNGRGIAPADLGKIFQPFFTTKAPGRGTGLGLSIAHEIARAHGGWIRAEPRPRGTCMRVYLPVSEMSDGAAARS